ncbi:sodium/proton antiporter (CPA1 family) [Archangium gephyra]|uniref:Sodium/hydrogen exchanger n=1 Tax=Archangium gephyra TaxID=48 RepID=A0AAC8QFV6_9BACT|nr:cation:proton antiporter [Archangium gephyra]AKJ06698.1 sodium/hydrogen exchanger [Archangium gephyra]REG31998.1 sodium/proton antiporter (CPA1 family) [Archangium gephyra]
MQMTVWFIVAGALLVGMSLGGSVLKRLPLSTSLLYLVVGFVLGRVGLGRLDAYAQAALLERLTEVGVLISLFTAGLKLRAPFKDPQWRIAVRLAFLAMALTVGLVTAVGVGWLGLPLGAAVLLGAVLAPTDPVLASDVQMVHPLQRDALRFGLTGEAGFNDGTAFPFVMLGLGLLGLHPLGEGLWRWVVVDVLWAVVAGLGVGTLLGGAVGRLVLYLRRTHREAVGLDDFLALGLISLSYGLALLVHAYGFLAVFAAGLALRRIEKRSNAGKPPEEVLAHARASPDAATDPEHAPAYMANAVLDFNEQLERLGEVSLVLVLGILLAGLKLPSEALWFTPLLFLVIRPAVVLVTLAGTRTSRSQRWLMSWFGIRGIGSLYYLFYALGHGLDESLAHRLVPFVLTVVAISIVVHGISVTPLMQRYERRQAQKEAKA